MTKVTPILLLALILAACSKEQEAVAPPNTATVADLAQGRSLAQAKCSNCHGLDGRGLEPLIPHLAGQKEGYLKLAMREYRTGERLHAALKQLFTELSEAELDSVAAYYASLAPIAPASRGDTKALAADAISAGRSAAAACSACHGEDGNAKVAGTPTLAGQHRDYLLTAMQAYKNGTRKHAVMNAQMSSLDTATLQNLAHYYAAQTVKVKPQKLTGDAKTGERLSAACGGCHGLQGQTLDARTPALAGQDPEYLIASMQAYRDGSRQHAEMKDLLGPMSAAELGHIAAYYAVQTPREGHATPSLSAREWAERCDRCHSPAVDNALVPRIDGQQRDYLAHVLRDYRDGKRQQSAMHAMGVPLTDADIEAIAEHYSTLQPR